ncbi:MAG TPA: hypothetical protein VNQ56_04625 [Pseudolabrys sp.]|nr:hypothetical protein [Pseudolabrys sp.]
MSGAVEPVFVIREVGQSALTLAFDRSGTQRFRCAGAVPGDVGLFAEFD